MTSRRTSDAPARNPQDFGTAKNARGLAFYVLSDHKKRGSFVAELIKEHASQARFSHEDRRFAAEIVYGVVRRKLTLNSLIEPHLNRPRHRVEEGLWLLLQIGVYQLLFMNSVPAHAAVHETVEVAKHIGKARWTGVLNGILRAVGRTVTTDLLDEPVEDAIPISPGKYRRCQSAVFANPEENPQRYYEHAFSFPSELANRWVNRYELDECCRLGFWFNAPAKNWLRVNRLKTNREEFLAALQSAEVEACEGELPESVLLKNFGPVDQLPGFEEGWFAVQDHSAIGASRLLAPQPGDRVLDLCAAPGTKTTHLAELMQNRGNIVATDVKPERLERIEENSRRLGITIIEPVTIDRNGENLPPGPFDAVLIDVPCSNTGVLGKRPEARWRFSVRELKELLEIQMRLLLLAADRLKPNGRMVYSTCSIEPEENQQLVRAVLQNRGDLCLLDEVEHCPGCPADGAYQALLVRRET